MGGRLPLPYAEIESFSRLSGANYSYLEAQTLRLMSEHYCSYANNPDLSRPYTTPETEAERNARALAAWEALADKQAKKSNT